MRIQLLSTSAILSLVAIGMPLLTPATSPADLAYGVTNNQFLISFDTSTPGTIMSSFALQGLQVNEQIVGIDFRPADNMLYGIGSSNQLYLINPGTGAASAVGPMFPLPLNGSQFGYDFNPTIDRSRIDTDVNKNYVINPNNGVQSQVTDLFYPGSDPNAGLDPNVVHIGYTNSFDGATTTQLYGIDTGLDILVTQANSAGTLGTVGSLGIDLTGVGGFDISGLTNVAWGAFQQNGSTQSSLYTVNLATGQATLVGQIGGGLVLNAFALNSIPEPSGMALLAGLATLGFARRRRNG